MRLDAMAMPVVESKYTAPPDPPATLPVMFVRVKVTPPADAKKHAPPFRCARLFVKVHPVKEISNMVTM